jgi:hypothetical protein
VRTLAGKKPNMAPPGFCICLPGALTDPTRTSPLAQRVGTFSTHSIQFVLLSAGQIPCLAHRFLVAHRIGDRSATWIFIPMEKDARPAVGKRDFVTAGVLGRDFGDVFQNADTHVG